jgi:hypothetical protein
MDELLRTAGGILGDTIDPEGLGWDGAPWILLFIEDEDGDEIRQACELATVSDAAMLNDVHALFVEYRPIACAYARPEVPMADGERVPKGARARIAVFENPDDALVRACRVQVADDGRQILVPTIEAFDSDLPSELDETISRELRRSLSDR